MSSLDSTWSSITHCQLASTTGFSGNGLGFILTNLITVAGFLLALVIIRRMFIERRNPSNFFAWFFFVLFVPTLGVPLYFLFGGRKSRRKARIKRAVQNAARAVASDPGRSESGSHLTEHPASSGNRFELLPDGQTAYHRLCGEIAGAKQSIHIATYILGNDPTGEAVVDLLCRRAAEGVEVRVLLDSLGSWNRTRAARFKIRKAGGKVAMFMPVLPLQTHTSANLRNHRKIALFDHRRAITGGQNIDQRFLGPGDDPKRFHDFGLVTEGPAVAQLNRTFIADWAFATKERPEDHREALRYAPPATGDSTLEVVNSGPDIEGDPLWEHIVRMVQEFREHLTIVTPYFVPDEVLFRSLLIKARTGRSIRIVLPLRSNHPLTDIARHYYLRALHRAGAEIHFFTPRMLHGKLIVADGTVAVTGSANIDIRSLFVNFETALLHNSKEDIGVLNAWAEALLPDCIPFAEAVEKSEGVPSRMAERLVNLVAPLL